MIYNFLFLLYLFNSQESGALIGKWKMVSYDAIDKFKTLPVYTMSDENERKKFDKRFNLTLEKEYIFKKDILVYTDLEWNDVVYRRATWHISNDTLYVKEIDRDFKREAYIHSITHDSLIMTPIIDGFVGIYKMKFVRSRE